jgi:hypothetical protein
METITAPAKCLECGSPSGEQHSYTCSVAKMQDYVRDHMGMATEKGFSQGYKEGAFLSRRERIATAVLGGWGAPTWSATDDSRWLDRQNIVQCAVALADALIAELDKGEGK